MPLTPEEIAEIDRRVQRAGAANCWTGTAGAIATDARALVRHIQGRTMSDDYPADHILRGERELRGLVNYLGDETESAVLTEDDVADVAHETRKAADMAAPLTPEPEATGRTAKFGTGAVRSDTVEAFRYDLVSPVGLREVARTCAEGAAKYDDFNWEKGMPVHDLLNHALAHIYQFLAGDRAEPHLPHAAWNLLAAIHSHELWPALNEGHLRRPGCAHPSAPPPA